MRLFISCHLSEEFACYLKELSKKLPEASLTVPKAFDLTMKFLGEVPDVSLSNIQERLSNLSFPAFEAEFDHVGVFSEKYIRVVWIGPKDPAPFVLLHKQIDQVLAPLFPETLRFSPHITLARIKSIHDKRKFISLLHTLPIEPQRIRIDTLLLVKSSLSSSGATHETLGEIFLQHETHSLPPS